MFKENKFAFIGAASAVVICALHQQAILGDMALVGLLLVSSLIMGLDHYLRSKDQPA